MSKRRVVITGLGLMTPCGQGWKPFWDAALESKSSIKPISSISLNGFPSKLAGEIIDFNAKDFVPNRKSLKLMSREIQLAVAASHLAITDSGLGELSESELERFGVSLGTGVINNELDEIGMGIRSGLGDDGKFEMNKFGSQGIRALFPLWFLKYVPNMPACHISVSHQLKGPSNTLTTSASAGVQAVGEAFRVIERGDADMMLTGSTDSKVNAMGISRFHLLGLLSLRNKSPKDVYCPFDEKADGIVIGEGAGLLVLEERERAIKRGAKIYAEVSGFGSAADYNSDPRVAGDFNGKRNSMIRAIRDAGIEPRHIEAIIANGSGVPSQDEEEVAAIHAVFKDHAHDIPVTGLKPVAGHLVYGSGGVEAAVSALSILEGILPPLINFETSASKQRLSIITEKPLQSNHQTVLLNSFGFGGQNASLVLKKDAQ